MEHERPTSGTSLATSSQLGRRELSISIIKVDMRLYRRTRQSCDISRVPPHFVYHLRLDWSGDSLPRGSSPPGSPRTPRAERPLSPGRQTGTSRGGLFDGGESWWGSLPKSYTVKRLWHEIVRFHEALVNELAYDSVSGCYRVKAKLPTLPGKPDIETWTNSYAATGDACALSRRKKLDPPTAVAPQGMLAHHAEAPMDDLEGLHWIYVELRLTPYFKEVNKILKELPTECLESSVALRRFVLPGSRGAMQKAPCNKQGIPRRFLGNKDPVSLAPEDIAAAVKLLRRTDPSILKSFSSPSLLGSGGSRSTGNKRPGSSAGPAAAKLIVAGGVTSSSLGSGKAIGSLQ